MVVVQLGRERVRNEERPPAALAEPAASRREGKGGLGRSRGHGRLAGAGGIPNQSRRHLQDRSRKPWKFDGCITNLCPLLIARLLPPERVMMAHGRNHARHNTEAPAYEVYGQVHAFPAIT